MSQPVSPVRDLDATHLLHGLSDPRDRDNLIVLVRGDGVIVEDEAGRRYIDGISGMWTVHLGHGQEALVEAAAEQMRRLAFATTYSGFANVPAIELAARLSTLAGGGLTATFFTPSGADANEAAFKTARFYWRRRGRPGKVKILSLEHSFHGVTLGAMSATGMPAYAPMFEPRLPEFIHVRAPYPYRCDFAFPNESPGVAAARILEQTIQREGPETVAAFIAEPVQGAGGVIIPPPDYFPLVREVCDRYGVLFIADEVITGFGRTGEWFAVQYWGVRPDIMTFAKGVTSGYLPLGGMMVTQEMAEIIKNAPPKERWMHASTHSGHPVCCAVALRTLEILEAEQLVARSAQLGRYLLRRLDELLELEAVGEVRGLGLMAAVELVADRETKKAFDPALAVGDQVRRRAQQAGLIVRNRGDIIHMAPPFIISEAQLDEMVSTLRRAIEDTLRSLR